MNVIVPPQNLFKGELRFAVRIDWTRLRSFLDWQAVWWTENRAGRGKDEPPDARCNHGIEQVQTVEDVVAKIFGRIPH